MKALGERAGMHRFAETLFTGGVLVMYLAGTGVTHGDDYSAYTEYITSLESLEDKAFRDILLQELDNYIVRFPAVPNLAEMHSKRATIFRDKNDDEEELFAYMEILYLYPKAEQAIVAKAQLRTLIDDENKFKALRPKTDELLQPRAYGENPEEAFYLLLHDMVKLDFDRINHLVVAATGDFLLRYSNSEYSHQVLFWRAQLLEKQEDFREALSEYLKLTHLHRGSIHLTTSRLKVAQLYTEELKSHQKAILALEEFLLEHPDDPQAPQAQFRIAEITEKRKKQYLEAVNAYITVAQKYPESVEAVPAMFEAARVYEVRFKEYDQAIRVYTEIVRDHPNDLKAPYALAELANVYEKRLKDPLNAANAYFKIFASYPQSGIAAESLFAAADICHKQLKDLDKAKMYYALLLEKYPGDKLARKATDRIADIDKELAKSAPDN
jgi:TolA-binding protein